MLYTYTYIFNYYRKKTFPPWFLTLTLTIRSVLPQLKNLVRFIVIVWRVFSCDSSPNNLLSLFILWWIGCQHRGRIDVAILSWIFTESVIGKCFDVSRRTADRKQKRAISGFVSEMCGVDVDVSCAVGQCECLLGAITVCLLFFYYTHYLFISFMFHMMPSVALFLLYLNCITWLEWGWEWNTSQGRTEDLFTMD